MSFPAVKLALAPNVEAASVARQSLGELKDLVSPEKLEDLRLLVTELVTNSVRHSTLDSGEGIQLAIQVSSGVIRGEVTDPGPGFEKPFLEENSPLPTLSGNEPDSSGWGLYLVYRIADRWGVERGEYTRVWFEIEDRADVVEL